MAELRSAISGGELTLDLRDELRPELRKLAKKTRNLRPAMRKIEALVMKPLKERKWRASGLESHSGELEEAVQTWHGKKSAGVAIRKPRGRNLVLAKASRHMEGSKKHQFRKRSRTKVNKYTREGRRVRSYSRKNVGAPWGLVQARPFLPSRLSAASVRQAARIIERFIDV